MLTLLAATITASFFDSLNPSAIAQQMVLQAAVKKKQYIWFFIIGIGLANFAMGVAVYYGLATTLSAFWAKLSLQYPLPLCAAQILVAIACLFVGIRMLVTIRQQVEDTYQNAAKMPKRALTPPVLFGIGVAFCAVELTSALPYFGFLALLAGYQLTMPSVFGFIFLYTLIYAAPLILLYFGYNRLQGTVIIKRLEQAMNKISAYILPAAISILGFALLFNGGFALLQ